MLQPFVLFVALIVSVYSITLTVTNIYDFYSNDDDSNNELAGKYAAFFGICLSSLLWSILYYLIHKQ
jgi:hypothetical protein